MCGTPATQSIGEPATQMTLNTFHYASVSHPYQNTLTFHVLGVGYHPGQDVGKEFKNQYDPHPTSTIIKEDSTACLSKSFFTIPDKEIKSKLHLQSPWLLRLVLDCARMVGQKLITMAYVASCITESFEMHLFTTWSMPGVHQVFLLEHDKMYANDEVSIKTRKEWALETDGVNLKVAMCIPGVSFSPTYLNNCVESFTTLRVEAMCATIMKKLMPMAITCHGINYPDTGALMHCLFEEMVEILMEAAAIGENNDCHGITKEVMFGQLVPMGTDAIVDHHLLVQNILTAHVDCSMTPSQVAMTPYDMNSPTWSESNCKGELAALSPLATNGREDPANFSFLRYGKSPLGAGDMSPASPPGYSPELSQCILTYIALCPSISIQCNNLTICLWYSLQLPSFSPTSPWYSPTGPSFVSKIFPCTNATLVSKILTHVTGVTLLTQIFQFLQVIFQPLLPSVTGTYLLAVSPIPLQHSLLPPMTKWNHH
ncbi:hypothetical protein F5J12DRAFT_936003 [Pisolithus orientalis]|uniref:uncharacterized protein n=1 Tax=Pisolithus orientalis TaxID=936130 RepID=UPI0022258251|nr:uncharacterized protein F5J12DRAFT_936003 [Pisolithus orientalis]KAI6008907.1 hypothetical protein F5J12DRAFT_936003 [Pisolithus orientalis]